MPRAVARVYAFPHTPSHGERGGSPWAAGGGLHTKRLWRAPGAAAVWEGRGVETGWGGWGKAAWPEAVRGDPVLPERHRGAVLYARLCIRQTGQGPRCLPRALSLSPERRGGNKMEATEDMQALALPDTG